MQESRVELLITVTHVMKFCYHNGIIYDDYAGLEWQIQFFAKRQVQTMEFFGTMRHGKQTCRV